MTRIVDLTLPIVTGMAGIPKIPLYEQYPVKVQAATVVDEDQRARLAREGVDVMADAPAVGHMDTVLTLNTHIGTHIDAPRHFLSDGGPVDELALDRLVMRDAVVLDVSGKPAGAGVSGDDLARTGVIPSLGQVAVIKTLWTDPGLGPARVLERHHPPRAERERVDGGPRSGGGRHGLLPARWWRPPAGSATSF
jgi:arylformamidase